MDNRITAVLEIYHEMIRKEREEREHRRGRPLELGAGELDRRLLAIGPQTGQFINILARSLTAPTILELGTSFGYSGIWLADAARAAGGRLITVETKDYESAFAHEMSEKAGLAEYVRFFVGDAIQITQDLQENFDFVLVDVPKQMYLSCLKAFYPKLKPGAIIVADNVRPGRHDVMDYADAARSLPGMTSFPVPVGNGLEISRYKGW